MFPRLTTFAIALLGAATISAAPAHAGVIFSQDFSGGLQANEKLGGGFSIGRGQMGHLNGAYANNERSFYELSLDLTNLIDAMISFDWTLSAERGWDGWNLLAARLGAWPASAVPSGVVSRQDQASPAAARERS